MIRGLRITIEAAELSARIGERIRMHTATVAALEARIGQREGGLPFEVRPEDDFKTVGELESERQRFRDRAFCLALLRDHLVAGEVYVLDRRDLRLAELISADAAGGAEPDEGAQADAIRRESVDGLKLTLSGDELRTLLERRIDDHRRRAVRRTREQMQPLPLEIGNEALRLDQVDANQAEQHAWRAAVLMFIHDHVDSGEV